MKVPRPPLTYSKEKGITKRTVKGASGGMQGVDYEDSRRPDMNAENLKAAAAKAAKPEHGGQIKAAALARAEAAQDQSVNERGAPAKDLDEMVLDDEDATTRDNKAKQNKRVVARDRLTIDKDAPHLKRSKDEWERVSEDEEEDSGDGAYAPAYDPEEFDLQAIGEAVASAGDAVAVNWSRFEDEAPVIGDPSLVYPDDIRRALGSPTAYAKHLVILTEAFRFRTGAHRQEAVAYTAEMLVGVSDRNFGRSALRELGPGTGIVDIYPLEVLDHLIENFPAFLPKAGFGRIVARPTQEVLHTEVGVPLELSHPPSLLMRGFALTDDRRPGYRFEPGTDEGSYRLSFSTPGRHSVLVSGMVDNRYTIVDRFVVVVTGEGEEQQAEERTRDPAAVEAWPRAEVPPLDPRPWLQEEKDRSSAGLLDRGEIVSRQQLDALRGSQRGHQEWTEAPDSEWLGSWSNTEARKIISTRKRIVQDWLQDTPAGVLEDALRVLAPPSTRVLEDAPVEALLAALDAIDPEHAAAAAEAVQQEQAPGEATKPEVAAYVPEPESPAPKEPVAVTDPRLGVSRPPSQNFLAADVSVAERVLPHFEPPSSAETDSLEAMAPQAVAVQDTPPRLPPARVEETTQSLKLPKTDQRAVTPLPLELGPIPQRPFEEDATEALEDPAPGTSVDDTYLRDMGSEDEAGFDESYISDLGDDGLEPWVSSPIPLEDTYVPRPPSKPASIEPLVRPPRERDEED